MRTNADYVYEMHVTDTEGATNSARIYFDTFDPNSGVIEAEDYNFGGGRFIDSPNLAPEGVPDEYAYWNKSGIPSVDFLETGPAGGSENTYRPLDPVGLERSTDFERQCYLLAGGASADVYDYSVARFRAGEWLNYTRTFGASAYTVRLRQSLTTIPPSAALLEQVTTNANALRVVPLGAFLYPPTAGGNPRRWSMSSPNRFGRRCRWHRGLSAQAHGRDRHHSAADRIDRAGAGQCRYH